LGLEWFSVTENVAVRQTMYDILLVGQCKQKTVRCVTGCLDMICVADLSSSRNNDINIAAQLMPLVSNASLSGVTAAETH